jgi:exopolyphosphatase / guanosine-5'-triphosphate,3'-diphosphate pyrophosphatase
VKPRERLAVIDLGSNSFRLVVFMAGEGWWKRTDEIYESVRIGEGLARTGKLGKRPIARALATLDVFAHFARASGLAPEEIDAVATSAIRDADNAESFLADARELTGLPIRVLGRLAEARYGYLAAVNSTTLRDGFVLDLGGGSAQLVRVSGRAARETRSWRIGTVRMSERFLPPNGPAKRRQIDALREHVQRELADAEWLAPRSTSAPRRLVGVGGTVRNLAAAAQRAAGLPSNGVQGMFVAREQLDELVTTLASMPASERASVAGIKPARADIILAGALVVQTVLAAGDFEGFEATEAGLREGVFFERLLSERREPLFEDVRRASVFNLAARYHVDVAHTQHVAELALGMFDELARLGVHDGEERERELLWAACMLHDIGMSIDYDDHHKHSRYLILSAGLPGFEPVEVAIIAQAARYHRKGMPAPGPLQRLFAEGDAERLDRCAVLLRLAEDLERSRDQLVRATRFERQGAGGERDAPAEASGERRTAANGARSLELRLISDGDAPVPRWAAGRETDLFARAFGRRLSLAA